MKLVICVFLALGFCCVSWAQDFPVRLRLFADLNSFPKIPQARLKPMSKTVWIAEGSSLVYQGKILASKNFIIKKPNEKYDVISIFDFNTYLAGVISKEMPLAWPLEALKAQAVIARSYALAKIRERQNKAYHLDTDQMDQVFAVTTSEKAKLAVALTDQIILKDRKNRTLKAFYHADCGGQTIPASKVWKDSIDSGTAVDPWCQARRSNEWKYEIAAEDFFNQLKVSSPLHVEDAFQGRIQSLRFLNQVFPLQKIRQIFGFSKVRNSPITIEQAGTIITMRGKGYGHGAGLCQWGAMAQAKMGRSYMQILAHYYTDAVLSENRMRLSKTFMADLVFN